MEIITVKQVCKMIGVSRVTLWRMSKEGSFLQPVRRGFKGIGYIRSEVQDWIIARAAERVDAMT